jgi:hypothetical protein
MFRRNGSGASSTPAKFLQNARRPISRSDRDVGHEFESVLLDLIGDRSILAVGQPSSRRPTNRSGL